MEWNRQMCNYFVLWRTVWKKMFWNSTSVRTLMLLLSVAALRCVALPACLRQAKNFMWHGAEVKRRKKMCIFIQDFFARHFFVKSIYLLEICLQFCGLFSSSMWKFCMYYVDYFYHVTYIYYFLQKLEMAAKIGQIKVFISTLALKLKSFLDITALGNNRSFWKYYILHDFFWNFPWFKCWKFFIIYLCIN